MVTAALYGSVVRFALRRGERLIRRMMRGYPRYPWGRYRVNSGAGGGRKPEVRSPPWSAVSRSSTPAHLAARALVREHVAGSQRPLRLADPRIHQWQRDVVQQGYPGQ